MNAPTLGEIQERFVELEAQWVQWVLSHPGWKLRHGEGRILAMGADVDKKTKKPLGRKATILGTDHEVRVEDRVHMRGGPHYLGTGADWQLFVNGEHVTRSDAPEWVACGEKWETLGGAWGGRFDDGNHLSVAFGGVR